MKVCGNAFMKLLLDRGDSSRLYSLRDQDFLPYLRQFYATDMKYSKKISENNHLKGLIVHIDKIMEIYKNPKPEKEANLYRKYIKHNLTEMRSEAFETICNNLKIKIL